MVAIADHVFPPIDKDNSANLTLDYSSFTYWREPMTSVQEEASATHTPDDDMKHLVPKLITTA